MLRKLSRAFSEYVLIFDYVKECITQPTYGALRRPMHIKPPVFENVFRLDVVLCRLIDDFNALKVEFDGCGAIVVEFLKRLFDMFVPRNGIGHCEITAKDVILEALNIVGTCEALGDVLKYPPSSLKDDLASYLLVRGQSAMVPDDDEPIVRAALGADEYVIEYIVTLVSQPRAVTIVAKIAQRTSPKDGDWMVQLVAEHCRTALPFIDLPSLNDIHFSYQDEELLKEWHVQCRLLLLHTLDHLWKAHGGKVPDRRLTPLIKALMLRRFCRTPDGRGMTEPFGQAVAAFL